MRLSRLLRRAWPFALLGVQTWLAVRSVRAYRDLPELSMEPASGEAELPPVSIIVPARDEARTLPDLLPSLTALRYPRFEVVVVDDGSTDDTARIAAAAGAIVIPAPPLPAGWAGKPHACAVGAEHARHDWLLFTDADTVHASASLAAAIAFAHTYNLEALSLFPAQECVTPAEQLLLPYAYRHFFAGVDARHVNDSRHRESLANGQYILIARDAYERIGGHRAVRDSVIEDVALAALFKRARVRYRMVRAGDLVRVRMYHGLGEIRAGFAKNSSRFLLHDPARGVLVVLSTLLDGTAPPLLAAGLTRRDGRLAATAIGSWAIGALALGWWARRFGVRRFGLVGVLQPVAAALFQTVSLSGMAALRPGGTTWKGRRY